MEEIDQIKKELQKAVSATHDPSRFFKPELSDKFMGIKNPDLRLIAKKFQNASADSLQSLINSEFNEIRLLALFIVTLQYKKNRHGSFEFFMQNILQVNNWNLVDGAAHLILGRYVFEEGKDYTILRNLCSSSLNDITGKSEDYTLEDIWKTRIAIVSTLWMIRKNEIEIGLEIGQLVVQHPHHMVGQAVGWILREIQKKDATMFMQFIHKNIAIMPNITFSNMTQNITEEEKMHLKLLRIAAQRKQNLAKAKKIKLT